MSNFYIYGSLDDVAICADCCVEDGICGHTGKCRECGGYCPECDEHEEEDKV